MGKHQLNFGRSGACVMDWKGIIELGPSGQTVNAMYSFVSQSLLMRIISLLMQSTSTCTGLSTCASDSCSLQSGSSSESSLTTSRFVRQIHALFFFGCKAHC